MADAQPYYVLCNQDVNDIATMRDYSDYEEAAKEFGRLLGYNPHSLSLYRGEPHKPDSQLLTAHLRNGISCIED